MALLGSPLRWSLVPAKSIPSASTAGTSMMGPGVAAPMSTWCAVVPAKPTSLPWKNTGTMMARSGVCDAPWQGWLCTTASPSNHWRSSSVSAMPRR